jgi:hypothetical protein
MLSSTANFNSFYSVSKGIRRETLLKLSRIKSLLPVNLPRVNKTYFTTDSKNLAHIFASQFNSQLNKDSSNGKIVFAYSTTSNTNVDNTNAIINHFDLWCNNFVRELRSINSKYTKSTQEYPSFIFYFYLMNKEFFVRASVKLLEIEDFTFSTEEIIFNNKFSFFKGLTLYTDPTITNVIYIGYYVVATNKKEIKEEYYQRIKISLKT